MPGHVDEQIELLRSEPDFLSSRMHPPRLEIDPELPDVERRGVRLAATAPERGPDAREQFVDAERLGHVIVGARIEGLDLRPFLAFDGEHDNRHGRHGADPAAQLDAVHPRHVQIGDDELRPPFSEVRQRRLAFGGDADLIALAGQDRPQHARDLRFIVNDQHSRFFRNNRHHSATPSVWCAGAAGARPRAGASRLTGRTSTIDAPRPPGPSSIHRRPACASTRRLAMGSPSPMPPRRGSWDSRSGTRKNFSNTRSRRSIGMPGPSSVTRRQTWRSSARAAAIVSAVPGGAYLLALSSRMYITSAIDAASTDNRGSPSATSTAMR